MEKLLEQEAMEQEDQKVKHTCVYVHYIDIFPPKNWRHISQNLNKV